MQSVAASYTIKMEENSMPMEKIAKLTALLVLLIIIIVVLTNSFGIWEKAYTPQQCRKYIELSAGLHSWDNIECSIQEIRIDDPEEINEKLAKAMAECKWQYGEGKIPLFDSDNTVEKRFCAPCAFIEFEGDAKGQEVTDLRVFLREEEPPMKYESETYAEYLIGRKLDENEKTPGLETEIDTDKLYATIFLYVKDSNLETIWKNVKQGEYDARTLALGGLFLWYAPVTVGGAATLAAVTVGPEVIIGTADSQAAVILMEYNEENYNKLNCTDMPVKMGNKE